jgi:hypothetical protein
MNDLTQMYKKFNSDYEILTPTGFKSFDGIAKYPKQVGITLSLSDGTTFNCASGHLLKADNKFIPASETLCKPIGHNNNVTVLSIDTNSESEHYYDILEVEGHEYISSGIVSHNCEFIGSVSTLIDHNLLKSIKHEEPIKIPNLPDNIRIFELPKQFTELEYVASLDSGYGVYKDYTVLQITLVKSNTNVHQVAVYSANNVDIEVFCKKAAVLLKKYHNPGLIIEQNGPGIAALKYFYSKLEYDNLIHFDPRGYKTGLWVTPKTKLQACVIFKTFVQRKFLKIKDKETIKEMFSFGRLTDMKWGGMGGNHDDHITSMYWIPFYINSPMFGGNNEEVALEEDGDDLSNLVQEDLSEETDIMKSLKDPDKFYRLMDESTKYGGSEGKNKQYDDEQESEYDEYEDEETVDHNGSIMFTR